MEYLPLGSVVKMKGSPRNYMIIARGLILQENEKQFYVDYGAVLHPEGLIQDRMFYINRESISEVVAEGYKDANNERFVTELEDLVRKTAPPKADLQKIRKLPITENERKEKA